METGNSKLKSDWSAMETHCLDDGKKKKKTETKNGLMCGSMELLNLSLQGTERGSETKGLV